MSKPHQRPSNRIDATIDSGGRSQRLSMGWCIALGVMASLVFSFPVAACLALVYRFPVPFAGYLSGIEAVIPAMFSVIFYGILGGVVVLAVIGVISGILAHTTKTENCQSQIGVIAGVSLLCVLSAELVLAVLDEIIGPW